MPLKIGTPLPDLSGATEWINGEIDPETLLGHPVLVHFWAKSCYICHNNMPTIGLWRDQYSGQGLKVIAIHAPREPSDTKIEVVQQDILEMGLTEPCAIDNQHILLERFQNQFWPAYFLFDPEGKMRSRTAGDAGLRMLQGVLVRLLETSAPENGPSV